MADLQLGGQIDPATRERTDVPAVLPSGDLTTHGVIIGMTGSGKTGLGVVLIEECLASGVPALLIDPKGDLTNLALLFPDFQPADFRPWVNEGDAQKAEAWREGLAGWGITSERMAAYRGSVDFTIYTPGSSAGRPLNIVGSLQAPPADTDPEIVSDEIDGYVSSMLGMLGIDADPISSREHILLANLIQNAWSQGQSLDLATLLAQVQQPPIRKLGVLELDTFFPPSDRMAFALKINGLLASPSFATWLQGDPIDIQSMLFTPEGRPRCAIITTAHLSDDQRQSVSALVLSKLVTWMRRQSGTSDLRALLYMDEVAGYLPPTANPPTKKPIMLLLKQARAFGLGVVLSTQNPVDLDYKALSNAGTWMVGRLQTEQDKNRLVDGLTSAAGTVDIKTVGDTISSLGKRQFLMKRASKDSVEVITSRWAMSYLRGPLTREQIGMLTPEAQASAPPVAATADAPPAPAASAPPAEAPAEPAPAAQSASAGDDETPVMPTMATGVPVAFLDPATPWLPEVGAVAGGLHLRAGAIARVHLRYDDEPAKLVYDEEYEAVLVPLTQVPDGRAFVDVDYDDRDLVDSPPAGAVYGIVHADVKTKSYWNALQKALVEELVRSRTTEILVNPTLKVYSRVGETQDEFVARCEVVAGEMADKELAKLRTKYETKLATARQKASDAQITASQHQAELEANFGIAATVTSVLGSVLGGRRSRTSIVADARRESAARTKAQASMAKAGAALTAVQALEQQLADEVVAVDDEWRQKASDITTKVVPLEKTDVRVLDFRCVWVPVA